jgi:hypothetical protein
VPSRRAVLLSAVASARDERCTHGACQSLSFPDLLKEKDNDSNRMDRRHTRGEASTEALRQAMIHYRALFDNLVGAEAPAASAAAREPETAQH